MISKCSRSGLSFPAWKRQKLAAVHPWKNMPIAYRAGQHRTYRECGIALWNSHSYELSLGASTQCDCRKGRSLESSWGNVMMCSVECGASCSMLFHVVLWFSFNSLFVGSSHWERVFFSTLLLSSTAARGSLLTGKLRLLSGRLDSSFPVEMGATKMQFLHL